MRWSTYHEQSINGLLGLGQTPEAVEAVWLTLSTVRHVDETCRRAQVESLRAEPFTAKVCNKSSPIVGVRVPEPETFGYKTDWQGARGGWRTGPLTQQFSTQLQLLG